MDSGTSNDASVASDSSGGGTEASRDAAADTSTDTSAGDGSSPDSAQDSAAADADDGSVPDAADASDANAADVPDTSPIGPAPGCDSFTEGNANYAASPPRLTVNLDLAAAWVATDDGVTSTLRTHFNGIDGGLLSHRIAPVSGSVRAADVAALGSAFAAVYASNVNDAGTLLFLPFDGGAGPDAGSAISVTAGAYPLLARGTSELGMTWQAPSGQLFSRLSNAGALLDSPQSIAGTPFFVAQTGSEYGVLYAVSGSPGTLKLARFSASTGAHVGTDASLTAYQGSPQAAATGDGYVLTWLDPSTDGGLPTYVLGRFDATGAPVWKVHALPADALAWTGTEIGLLYFTTTGTGVSTTANAHLDRYTGAGAPILPSQKMLVGLADPKETDLVWTGSRYSFGFRSAPSGASASSWVVTDCFVGQ
jgi:hypothetical protein